MNKEQTNQMYDYFNSDQYEEDRRAYELTKYTVEELEAELERREDAKIVPELFPNTLAMLDKFTKL